MNTDARSDGMPLTLPELSSAHLLRLCGAGQQHIHMLEDALGVRFFGHPGDWHIQGAKAATAAEMLRRLSALPEISAADVEAALRMHRAREAEGEDSICDDGGEDVTFQAGRRRICGKTPNQRRYLKALRDAILTVAVGPAGSGKTYLAVARAVADLQSGVVERIVLTRPAVEAGERLGFLPGDLQQKVDPYLTPLFDALSDMLGAEKMLALMEKRCIEVAPLAYMRGRTLNDAFVILDEAQNTTRSQMKMFLTRLGFSSRMVVTGDVTQVDLPHDHLSGLLHAIKVLRPLKDVRICHLQAHDVVRHRLVEKIVRAYEADEGEAS